MVDAGDVINFGTALGATLGTANWQQGSVFVGGSLSAAGSGAASAIGSVGVFVSGTNTFFAVKTVATAGTAAFYFQVAGTDLVAATQVGQNVAFNSSNFGFTLSSTNGGLTLTLS